MPAPLYLSPWSLVGPSHPFLPYSTVVCPPTLQFPEHLEFLPATGPLHPLCWGALPHALLLTDSCSSFPRSAFSSGLSLSLHLPQLFYLLYLNTCLLTGVKAPWGWRPGPSGSSVPSQHITGWVFHKISTTELMIGLSVKFAHTRMVCFHQGIQTMETLPYFKDKHGVCILEQRDFLK